MTGKRRHLTPLCPHPSQSHRELTVHRHKWEYIKDFESSSEGWLTASCKDLSPDEIQAKVGP